MQSKRNSTQRSKWADRVRLLLWLAFGGWASLSPSWAGPLNSQGPQLGIFTRPRPTSTAPARPATKIAPAPTPASKPTATPANEPIMPVAAQEPRAQEPEKPAPIEIAPPPKLKIPAGSGDPTPKPDADSPFKVDVNVTPRTPATPGSGVVPAPNMLPSLMSPFEIDPNTPSLFPAPAATTSAMMPTDTGIATAANGVYADDPVSAGPLLGTQFSLDGGGNVTLMANPDPQSVQLGTSYAITNCAGWLRSLNMGIYARENQLVTNGGFTMSLYDVDGFGIGMRSLFGAVDDWRKDQTQFTYSGDLYTGFRAMQNQFGEHWFKAGMFVDIQDQFWKFGPELAGLFFANEEHPSTFDLAIGFSDGAEIYRRATNTLVEAADRDYQVRVGTFIGPTWQIGMTTQVATWNQRAGLDDAEWSFGGFTNFMLGRLLVGMDLSVGEETRGYATVAWMFGGPPTARPAAGQCWAVDGNFWAMQPVQRDVTIRTREKAGPPIPVPPTPFLFAVQGIVVSPPRRAIGTANADGIVQPGETFELDLQVTNNSGAIANVQIGGNVSIGGTAGATPQGISGANFGAVNPGQTVISDRITDINVDVPIGATPGQTILVTCDIIVDGVTRRVTFGPIIVGGASNGQVFVGSVR